MTSASFDCDIFISYAHIDNRAFSGDTKGWIDYLHERLATRLAKALGRSVTIWRDRKSDGNDVFTNEVKAQLQKAAVFVAVLSPSSLQSSSCRAEMENFTQFAEQHDGLRIGNKPRIFKVIKTESPLKSHPATGQELLGYEFYERDTTTDKLREFDHVVTDDHRDKRYWDKFEDLAADILETLRRLYLPQPLEPLGGEDPVPEATASVATELPTATPEVTVYLAETPSHLTDDRDSIRRELQQHRYRVVPDQPLPRTGPELEHAVREYLRQATLSVHLLGDQYGMVPEDDTRSIPHIQLDLAAERCNEPNFFRLIGLPIGVTPADERQQQLIKSLQQDTLAHSELLQAKLEDLKKSIQTKLTPRPAENTVDEEMHNLPIVYLICDQQDYDEARPVEYFLHKQRVEVLPSLFGGNKDVAQYHKESLQLCDAVLIYYGRVSPAWAHLKRLDLLKLSASRRERPLRVEGFYLSAPPNQAKEQFNFPNILVIRSYNGFDADVLTPFLNSLKQPRAGA